MTEATSPQRQASDHLRHGSVDDKQTRKREQNRQAQRTYRYNQKRKMKALEATIAQSLRLPCSVQQLPAPAPAPSTFAETGDSYLMQDPILALPEQRQQQQQQQPQRGDKYSNLWTPESTCAADDQPAIHSLASQAQPVLHIAAGKENVSMARLLLSRGADINQQDCGGRTALHLATERGSEAMMRLFLERSAENNDDYNAGQTPVSNVSMDLTPLNETVDVNCKDFTGRTALHIAVERGFESLVHLLLDHGANISAS